MNSQRHFFQRIYESTGLALFGGFLGNKASGVNVKYASDPYWGEKGMRNVAGVRIKANGNRDAGKYTIGVQRYAQ